MKPVAFTGGTLDRADELRRDDAALAAHRATGRLLLLDGIEPRLTESGALVWGDHVPDEGDVVFLGLDADGRAAFAAVPQEASTGPASPALWAAMAHITPADLAAYGMARSLVGWHARHRFCPRCGGATVIAKGGWQRDCVNEGCRTPHFSRTDPVVIMSVEHDGCLLLGRQPRFPAGRYSTLAGFVEPGEGLEEAVAREIHEEAGVRVRDVRYVASQPWPFPSSLMIACHAFADDDALTIDTTELDDARWFTRDQVVAAMRGQDDAAFIAPPPFAVAHHLLRWWIEQ